MTEYEIEEEKAKALAIDFVSSMQNRLGKSFNAETLSTIGFALSIIIITIFKKVSKYSQDHAIGFLEVMIDVISDHLPNKKERMQDENVKH